MKDSTSIKHSEDLRVLVVKSVADLGLPKEVEQEANSILEQAVKLGVSPGRNPRGQAAAAVYIASILSDNRVTQDAIAQTFKVSAQIIRVRYVELVKALGIYSDSK